MKSKIIIGFEFVIFLVLLGAVIIYSQVLIKKIIENQSQLDTEKALQTREEKDDAGVSTSVEQSLPLEEKYNLLKRESEASTSSLSTDEKRKFFTSSTASSTESDEIPLTLEEKMKLLE